MKQSLAAGLAGLSVLAVMGAPALARAMMIAPAPVNQRAAVSDVVVVGKVTGFGDKLVNAQALYGDAKVDYQIAVVRVEDALVGAKDAKEIKVGFLPPPPPPPPPVPGRPFLLVKHYPQFTLSLDQEACLFLVKHPTEDFYVGVHYYDFINKNGPNFDKDMDDVKRAAKLLADPAAGLESKQAEDRVLTAELLVVRYRTAPPGGTAATEPIDAAQSKQILLALADADWGAPKVAGGFALTPQSAFFRLGLTAKDGWTQPKDLKALPDAAKAWLKDNADKYRVERLVAAKKDDK